MAYTPLFSVSEATYVNSTPNRYLLDTLSSTKEVKAGYAADEVISKTLNDLPCIQLEPRLTNQYIHSHKCSHYSKKNVTVVDSVLLAPDGTTTGARITEIIPPVARAYQIGNLYLSEGIYTATFFLRYINRPIICVNFIDNSGDEVKLRVDLQNKVLNAISTTGTIRYLDYSITAWDANWTYVTITLNVSSYGGYINLNTYNTADYFISSGESFGLWNPTCVLGPYETAPIWSESSTLRNGDSIYFSGEYSERLQREWMIDWYPRCTSAQQILGSKCVIFEQLNGIIGTNAYTDLITDPSFYTEDATLYIEGAILYLNQYGKRILLTTLVWAKNSKLTFTINSANGLVKVLGAISGNGTYSVDPFVFVKATTLGTELWFGNVHGDYVSSGWLSVPYIVTGEGIDIAINNLSLQEITDEIALTDELLLPLDVELVINDTEFI